LFLNSYAGGMSNNMRAFTIITCIISAIDAFSFVPSLEQRYFGSGSHQLLKAASGDATILPFDPRYSAEGPVGFGDFIIDKEGGPTEEELEETNLVKIVNLNCTDLEVNTLVWKCLGYRYNPQTKSWDNEGCFPKWKEKYPSPPDLIGMQRKYSPEIDKPSLRSNQALVRSIPSQNKQNLKQYLRPYGFNGYKYEGLTPNMTRRAQCTNWLLYYKLNLFGVSLEELIRRKQERQEAIKREDDEIAARGEERPWRAPTDEAY